MPQKSFTLTDSEAYGLANNCRVAAERYDDNAATAKDEGFPRLEQQFAQQAISARLWADKLEQADHVTITPSPDEPAQQEEV